MKKILVIEHSIQPEPDAGMMHLADRGCDVRRIHPFAGEQLPDVAEADGVMLMGGPQMVTNLDEAPYLVAEMEFAAEALKQKIPLMAICLGAQLVAHRLGGAVNWHPDDAVAFGYHQIRPTPAAGELFPAELRVLSGNAQGFDLPPGATLLATGETWPNQAFSIGERLLAFQFHSEVTRSILDEWQDVLSDNVNRPGADGFAKQDADFKLYEPALKDWYRSLLDRFFDLNRHS